MVFGDPRMKWVAWTSLAVVLIGAFGYGCFVLGGYRCEGEGGSELLLATDCDETDELARFNELDLAQVVDAGANEELRRTIKTLGDRIHSLEEEARFYRRLVAPLDEDAGFNIERIDISKTRDIDDSSKFLLHHSILDRPDDVERSRQINPNNPIPVFGRELIEIHVADIPSVIHKQLNRTERRRSLRHHFIDRATVGDVSLNGDRTSPKRTDLLANRLCWLCGSHIMDRNIGTFGGKFNRRCRAYTATGTRYQRNSSLKSHTANSFCEM